MRSVFADMNVCKYVASRSWVASDRVDNVFGMLVSFFVGIVRSVYGDQYWLQCVFCLYVVQGHTRSLGRILWIPIICTNCMR